MARTLSFAGIMQWPLEDGQQSAKLNLAVSLAYDSAFAIEKTYAAPVTDEALVLPMSSAKFLILRAPGTTDVSVKLNGGTAIPIKAAKAGFIFIHNPDGAITTITVTVATAPAKLEGYAFA